MTDMFKFADELGPYQIVYIYRPSLNLRAIVVIDNVACGPAIGGARMALDVSVEECVRLARAMTLKNAAAGLPHGGAKSVIFGDPHMLDAEKQPIIRAFATAIGALEDYIVGPDMGTDERCMGWIHDEIHRAVGLPRAIGGIPLDKIGATGFGVAIAAEVAQEFCGIDLKGARIAVQGFGAVGQHAARYLGQRGSKLVAASDSSGGVFNPQGFDVEKLAAWKGQGKRLVDFIIGEKCDDDEFIGVDCDIWIPAARPDVLTAKNVGDLKAKLVLQGANIPATSEAEALMHERGILSIPDFVANAGGVICASVEYHGGAEAAAMQTIEQKVRANTQEVLGDAKSSNLLPRDAANQIAESRLRRAMVLQRW